VGRLEGLLAGAERIDLRLEALGGCGELLLLLDEVLMLTLQIVDLLRQTGPAAECFAGEVLATDLHRLLRLPLQLALLLLELAHLQFEPLAARGDVRDTATHLLEELELLLVRVVECLVRILHPVEGLVRLRPEYGLDALEDAHVRGVSVLTYRNSATEEPRASAYAS